MTDLDWVLKNIEEKDSSVEKGKCFENLMLGYLKTDGVYQSKFKHVDKWREFAKKTRDFKNRDLGIDLVATTTEDKYWAIQCKWRGEEGSIDKQEIDTFISESSKHFTLIVNGERKKFSQRLLITVKGELTNNAEESIKNQDPPVKQITKSYLEKSNSDFKKIKEGKHGKEAEKPRKELRPHQKEALEKAFTHYKEHDRGQLIMACGTGKTYTSLKIVETETKGQGFILFLVPSIILIRQTLIEWCQEGNIYPMCICSDKQVSNDKQVSEGGDDIQLSDIPIEVTTNKNDVVNEFRKLEENQDQKLKVIFSTYHSIEVLCDAQRIYSEKYPESNLKHFDWIICDEAHRTTGFSLSKKGKKSYFTKVHDKNEIQAKKRMYMTGTSRVYGEKARIQSKEYKTEVLYSMDDTNLYGKEFYRLGFGEAVKQNLLSDYRVIILTVPENIIGLIKDIEIPDTIEVRDISKIAGCLHAISKQFIGYTSLKDKQKKLEKYDEQKEFDPKPMERAVAFCSTINMSKGLSRLFPKVAEKYINSLHLETQEHFVQIESDHIDGKMGSKTRDKKLDWLKEGMNHTNSANQ